MAKSLSFSHPSRSKRLRSFMEYDDPLEASYFSGYELGRSRRRAGEEKENDPVPEWEENRKEFLYGYHDGIAGIPESHRGRKWQAQEEAEANARALQDPGALKTLFPHLVVLEEKDRYNPRSVAKNIRQDLKKNFPKVKCEVRSMRHVVIICSYGKLSKEAVKEVIRKYDRRESLPEFGRVFGGTDIDLSQI